MYRLGELIKDNQAQILLERGGNGNPLFQMLTDYLLWYCVKEKGVCICLFLYFYEQPY